MSEVQQQYESMMAQNQENKRLQAISKEIDELVKDENTANDKIDFNQIMDENLNIWKEDATKIIAYIDELLSQDNFSENTDLQNLKNYLQPIANPISTGSINIEQTDMYMVDLNNPTINNLIKNREYWINSKIDTLLKSIKRNSSLSQVKDNLQAIKETLSNKKWIHRSELLSIHNFLKEAYPNPKNISINNGEGKTIDINNTEDESILVYLYAYLDNLSSQITELNDRNSTIESINNERVSTNAAINKFVSRSDFGNYSELNTGYPEIYGDEATKIIDYIKESGSDSIEDNSIKQNILTTYRKHLANKDNVQEADPTMNEIKTAIEENYVEIKIINDFIDNFIKSNENNEFRDAYLVNYISNSQYKNLIGNIDNLKNLFSLYVENDWSHNPDVISYYRKNLSEGNISSSIKDNYPEIQATEESINKLTNITNLKHFSKLSNEDIQNITNYITTTKALTNADNSPKQDILNYYNKNIKWKSPEWTSRDKNNFNAIKEAIEGDDWYREEIVKWELEHLFQNLGNQLINHTFDDDIIKSYRESQDHFCIFNEEEFNSYIETKRINIQEAQRNDERQANINTITNLINNNDLINNLASSICWDRISDMPLNINYDSQFTTFLSTNQNIYNSLDDSQKTEFKNSRISKLNNAMFELSFKYITSFDENFDNVKPFKNKVLYSLKPADIIGLINQKPSTIDETDTWKQKETLSQIQKIHYVLNTLANTKTGDHSNWRKEIRDLQNKIGMQYGRDWKFWPTTLSKVKEWIWSNN